MHFCYDNVVMGSTRGSLILGIYFFSRERARGVGGLCIENRLFFRPASSFSYKLVCIKSTRPHAVFFLSFSHSFVQNEKQTTQKSGKFTLRTFLLFCHIFFRSLVVEKRVCVVTSCLIFFGVEEG